MTYSLTLRCHTFPPITIKGDERTVCIQAERIMREMAHQGRIVSVDVLNASLEIGEYLCGVAEELETWPGGIPIKPVAPPLCPNQGNGG